MLGQVSCGSAVACRAVDLSRKVNKEQTEKLTFCSLLAIVRYYLPYSLLKDGYSCYVICPEKSVNIHYCLLI